MTGTTAVVATTATIAAAVFAAGAYTEARRQADIAQEAFINADRPWIKVAQPPRVRLEVDEGVVWLHATVEVQNIGRSPAQHTYLNIELLSDASFDEQTAGAENLCRRAAAAGYLMNERLVFPDDRNTLWNAAAIKIETVREKRDRRLQWEADTARRTFGQDDEEVEARKRERMAMPLYAGFTLVGCITYAVSPRQVVGQTAFIFGIDRACGLGPLGTCAFEMDNPGRYSGDAISIRNDIGGTFAR